VSKRSAISQLVSELGGAGVVAQAIGASRESVWMWSKLERIPYRWRPIVRHLVRRQRLALSVDQWRALQLHPELEESRGRMGR
jgi:hypothetical protein